MQHQHPLRRHAPLPRPHARAERPEGEGFVRQVDGQQDGRPRVLEEQGHRRTHAQDPVVPQLRRC